MLNIIKTDFYKLKKSKAFWICAALCIVFGVMMVIAVQADTQMELRSGSGHDYEQALAISEQAGGVWALGQFLPMNFSALIVGIFISVFVTSEFSYGTIKNTLSRGADRAKVFLSKFFVCGTAAVIMQILFIAALIAAGSAVWGYDPHGIASFGGLISVFLSQLFVIIGFAALFTFISTTIRANGGSIAVNILCSTVISNLFSALGMLLGIKIALNDYWIGGVVSKLATVTPASGDTAHGLIVTAAWGIASIITGIVLFKKMDVK
ncbi:MAG: ABC transporter permease [Oscillospiraceae bacterium]|nr:ABC transporter permease [Oscillospiraceae bacterium]